MYIFRGSWALSLHFDWKYIFKNLLNMLRECCKQFCWQGNLDECTDPWGIRVERVEMWVRLGRSFLPHLYTQHAVMVVVMWLRLSFLDPIEYLNAWSSFCIKSILNNNASMWSCYESTFWISICTVTLYLLFLIYLNFLYPSYTSWSLIINRFLISLFIILSWIIKLN